jgi:hypothetical protein
MPKKTKRRPIRRRPQDRSEDIANKQRWLDSAARTLLANTSPEQLRSELFDRQQLLDQADHEAQLEPSPANLARYRTARSQFEAAQQAVKLADTNRNGEG